MGQQRVRQLQKKAATPTAAPPTQKPFSWQRPFPVPAQDTATTSPQPMPDLQARLEILRRANPDWSKVKASSTPAKAVQAKLTVGAPNDVYEQEADRVADQVMSMPESALVQREMGPEEEEVQTKPLAATIMPLVQREPMPEEEEVQTKALAQSPNQRIGTLQREEIPEEDEALQTKSLGSIQREEMPEEDETLQTKPLANILQREEMPEEDEVQTKPLNGTLQREAMPEEDEMQMKALSNIQREKIPEEEEVQTKPALQRSTDGSLQASGSIESRLSSSQGGGSPLPDDVRAFMEPRFGADFSQVRVHTDSEAMQMNRDLNAQAFTHKQDVYFGGGKAPGKDALTAHELTHVVQQGATSTTAVMKAPKSNKSGPSPSNWKAINEYKHPGNVKVKLTLFSSENALNNPSSQYLSAAQTLLNQHGLDLDSHVVSTPLPYTDLANSIDSALELRMLAHKSYQDSSPRLPVIFCRFASQIAGEVNGVTIKETDWLPFVLINSDNTSPDGVTLLHEIGHASGLGHVGRGKNDVMENFMTYGSNRTGMTRNQVIAIANSYFAK